MIGNLVFNRFAVRASIWARFCALLVIILPADLFCKAFSVGFSLRVRLLCLRRVFGGAAASACEDLCCGRFGGILVGFVRLLCFLWTRAIASKMTLLTALRAGDILFLALACAMILAIANTTVSFGFAARARLAILTFPPFATVGMGRIGSSAGMINI